MSDFPEDLAAHLAGGIGTVCRAWVLVRRDGMALAFTDHDADLAFDGRLFRADSGLTASAVQQSTGLAVDNTEAMGALSSDLIREEDLAAGRYDGAEVTAWLVNWAAPEQRVMLFRGTLGEVTRAGGAFHAELRGLAEALNQPQGHVYQTPCSAVLGDARCGVDLGDPGYFAEVAAEAVEDGKRFVFAALDGFDDRWFERGRMRVLSGAAAGLIGVIKNDRLSASGRVIELWQDLRAPVAAGDMLRLEAGCDKRVETCRLKFDNIANHRGFPAIPGEDWLMAVPANQPVKDGGSRDGFGR
ncbi:DUF2163 domain-containing protein [Frigidibacter sp. ROC022]|uniref:DUF2163 domain-containing protein n=1 Tax=Frigidibacter sp. ROC022 TaxID=2971796 RepID=UPI00215B4545|nr:DUF2163 domain-containing protein [Frigidibacter sp. ROC022]MCR8723634.1 DUF2163 domain-containing protein [Frigidibacter sp. ROC022]